MQTKTSRLHRCLLYDARLQQLGIYKRSTSKCGLIVMSLSAAVVRLIWSMLLVNFLFFYLKINFNVD